MASVEPYSSDDELHVLIERFVDAYGEGELVAVVLNDDNTGGVAVSQRYRTIKTYPLEIARHADGFTLVMLYHHHTVKSDYFED